jgi:hypothetical protein
MGHCEFQHYEFALPEEAMDDNRATDDLYQRIGDALANVQPDSELDRVLKRWEGHDFTVKVAEKWRLGGFIDFFQKQLDIMHAVDPSIDPRLPVQCYDPKCIARFFRIPLEELVLVGSSGRKPTMDDVADFAAVRREKGTPWKDILREWRKEHPNDKRKITLSRMQEAFYRKYLGRGKTCREPPMR